MSKITSSLRLLQLEHPFWRFRFNKRKKIEKEKNWNKINEKFLTGQWSWEEHLENVFGVCPFSNKDFGGNWKVFFAFLMRSINTEKCFFSQNNFLTYLGTFPTKTFQDLTFQRIEFPKSANRAHQITYSK